jgi:hypothetical protein
MPGERLRVGSWNLKWGAADLALLDRHPVDLLAVQEASPSTITALRERFDWVHDSSAVLPPGPRRRSHLYLPAVCGSLPFPAAGRAPVDRLIAPIRLAIADVRLPSGATIAFASYHAMNGSKGADGLDKPRLTAQVAEWLEHESSTVVIGLDANSPAVDHPDWAQTVCHFDWGEPRAWEPRLLARGASHSARDVLRTWLETDPSRMEAVAGERPDGPLAISHRTRGGRPVRYDFILATSPAVDVVDVQYLYDEAIEAGSDHALVVADLSIS